MEIQDDSLTSTDTQQVIEDFKANFSDAVDLCNSEVNHFSTLARISNEEEFRIATDLVRPTLSGGGLSNVFLKTSFWIGIFDPTNDVNELDESNDTERFQFVDESADGLDFFRLPGRFPWGPDDPNGLVEIDERQNCVA